MKCQSENWQVDDMDGEYIVQQIIDELKKCSDLVLLDLILQLLRKSH